MSTATLRAGSAREPLRVGDQLPALKGQFLTGRDAGTPVELHDHVITVYGGAGDWKQRLSYAPAHEEDAYLVVLDREGVVRWLCHGGFDTARSNELKAVLASLVRPVGH